MNYVSLLFICLILSHLCFQQTLNDNVPKAQDINSTLICVAVYERLSLAISCGGFDYAQGECYPSCPKGQIRMGTSCYDLCPKPMKEGGNICFLENYSTKCNDVFIQGADRTCIKPNSWRHNSTLLSKIQPLCPENYVLEKYDCKLKCAEGYSSDDYSCRTSCPSMYVARKQFCTRNLIPWAKNATVYAAFNNSIPLCKKIGKMKRIGELALEMEKPETVPSTIFLTKTRLNWKTQSTPFASYHDVNLRKNLRDLNSSGYNLESFYK